MSTKQFCVIDAACKYITNVFVIDNEIQYYAIKDGESLIDAVPPIYKQYDGDVGFIDPVWDSNTSAWVEGATEEETAAWEENHPAPIISDSEPTQLDRVEAQATYTAMMTDTLLEV